MSFVSRRLSLFLVAVVIGLGACADEPVGPRVAPEDARLDRQGTGAPEPVTVMTRNLYLGLDFSLVLAGRIDQAVAQLNTTYFPLRAPALAAEILQVQPDLIGLQEVSTFQLSAGCPGGPATIDFLAILGAALGGAYQVVNSPNLTIPVPINASCVITYTDADAILVRIDPDIGVHGAGARTFADQVIIPGLNVPNGRGYVWADVTVDGQRFHFVNTHLEVQQPPAWGAIQELQAQELLDAVDDFAGPVIMVGDFNSAANPSAPAESRTGTYDLILDGGFDDVWVRGMGRDTDTGLTCCHAADLSNVAPDLDQRIDFVFARNVPAGVGFAGGVETGVVGDAESDGYVVFNPLVGADVHLWPSDHAGVYATLWMPPGLMARQ